MSRIEDIQQLRHKLHPQTGFMILFPGLCLMGVFLLLAFSHSPGKWSGMEGIAATIGIGIVAVGFGLWSDFGNAVQWDNEAVYVRQGGSRLFFRRHPFAVVPYPEIRGLILRPPPRGVPPKFPLLELDVTSRANGMPLLIDPNYFAGSSVETFINTLCERRPEMLEGKQGKAIAGLLRRLET